METLGEKGRIQRPGNGLLPLGAGQLRTIFHDFRLLSPHGLDAPQHKAPQITGRRLTAS